MVLVPITHISNKLRGVWLRPRIMSGYSVLEVACLKTTNTDNRTQFKRNKCCREGIHYCASSGVQVQLSHNLHRNLCFHKYALKPSILHMCTPYSSTLLFSLSLSLSSPPPPPSLSQAHTLPLSLSFFTVLFSLVLPKALYWHVCSKCKCQCQRIA